MMTSQKTNKKLEVLIRNNGNPSALIEQLDNEIDGLKLENEKLKEEK
jgi:hypothetical protein